MGNMSSFGYQTPTEAPIVEESLYQPLVDGTVKAEPENLENPEKNLGTSANMHGDVKSGDEIREDVKDLNIVQEEKILVMADGALEIPQGDSYTFKSKQALENPTVDSSCVKVQGLEKPEGDFNSLKAEETLETPQEDFNTFKSKEGHGNPTVDLSNFQSLEKPEEDSNSVKAEEYLESAQGDSNNLKSEEALEYPKVDSDTVKVQSFENPEGDSDSAKADEAPKKPEGGLKIQEHDEENVLYLFMKGGGCKDNFVAWERCIHADNSGENTVPLNCLDATAALVKCMQANIEYYRPVLGAEAEGTTELEKEDDHEEDSQTKAAANEELKIEKGKEDAQESN